MKKKIRYLVAMLSIVIVVNTVTCDYAKAGDMALTLAGVAASSGGAAAFGSAALGVAVPVLLAIGTVYAGYKIYQNREAITKTFYNWYTASSTAISNWTSDLAGGIEAGSITDGSNISIPRSVLNEVGRFYQENTLVDGVPVGEYVHISSLAGEMQNNYMRTQLQKNPYLNYVSYAPILHLSLKDVTNPTNQSIVERLFYGSETSTVGMMIYQMKSSNGVNYWYFDYLGTDNIVNGIINSMPNLNQSQLFVLGSQVNVAGGSRIVLPGGVLKRDGNTFNCDSWAYSITLTLPTTSFLGYVPTLLVADRTLGSSRDYEGFYEHALDASKYEVLQGGAYATRVGDNTIAIDKPYNPTLDNTDALSVPLTPDVINALSDYIVAKGTDELQLTQTLDKKAFGDTDTGTGTGVLDGIKDFFANPLASMLSLLQSIWDAIKAIPSSVYGFFDNVLQQIKTAVLSIPDTITNVKEWLEGAWVNVKDIPSDIVEGIQGIFQYLFVPSDVKVAEFVQNIELKTQNHAGILTYPISLVIKFLQGISILGVSDCVLIIPEIKYKGYVLLTRYEFNFTEFVERAEFKQVYKVYRYITNYIMIIAVVLLAVKKGDQIIRGN